LFKFLKNPKLNEILQGQAKHLEIVSLDLIERLQGQAKHLEIVSLDLIERLQGLAIRQNHLETLILEMKNQSHASSSPHFSRNHLLNDSTLSQKSLIESWRLKHNNTLTMLDLLESGFRVFSQTDEDGILLRIFTHIGCTNKFVIEIGSNCSHSEIGLPENLSTNLIIHHGWHGLIVEMDSLECEKMRYFFASNPVTKHFHINLDEVNRYYSPIIANNSVSPTNINNILLENKTPKEPDLLVIDIDGGDYDLLDSIKLVNPRVIVVEFEKRFRDRYCVTQTDVAARNRKWAQSGSSSLSAWDHLLRGRGYSLCAINYSGFNAFFVRSDVANGKLVNVSCAEAFDSHPVYSTLEEIFWVMPDESWKVIV